MCFLHNNFPFNFLLNHDEISDKIFDPEPAQGSPERQADRKASNLDPKTLRDAVAIAQKTWRSPEPRAQITGALQRKLHAKGQALSAGSTSLAEVPSRK